MVAAHMEIERIHLRFNHQINRGILWRRGWGLIFIKRASGFEAKKAITYELEAHSHRGEERKKEKYEEGDVVVVAETWRRKWGKELTSLTSWYDLLEKLLGLNSIRWFGAKLNSPRLEFEWLIFSHQGSFKLIRMPINNIGPLRIISKCLVINSGIPSYPS